MQSVAELAGCVDVTAWGRGLDIVALNRRGKRKGGTGQALVEFALVLPILVLLVTAIFEFAFVTETQIGLTNAVREAARRAAADPSPTVAGVTAQRDALLAANVQGYVASRVNPDPTKTYVRFCNYNVGGSTNYRVDVKVTYAHPVFFPLLSFATDFVDGTPDGAWTLSSTAQMRLELATPTGTPTCP